jgi:hypothetical protein
MDRTTLGRIVCILAALTPLSSRAQSSAPAAPAPAASGPVIAYVSGDAPHFVFYAGPTSTDIAYKIGGDLLVQTIELPDPADAIAAAIANAMAKRKGGQAVEGIQPAGRAAFTVTVDTTEWTAGYYHVQRPTYSMKYAVKVTITDASGAVVKTATCSTQPDDGSSAGGNDVLMAYKGRLMKSLFAKAARDCSGELVQRTKSL